MTPEQEQTMSYVGGECARQIMIRSALILTKSRVVRELSQGSET